MAFRCLFHVHTRHSFDSLLSPAKILAFARQAGVDVLIVSDHNTVRGAQEARALARGNPKFVVVAAEYKTDKGDLIGMFLKQEIRTRRSDEVIEQVRAQGGLVVLPHPYRGHQLDDALLAGVDLIEAYNSRCSAAENAAAGELAARLGRPVLGGPDAHCAAELGAVFNHFSGGIPQNENILQEELLRAPRRVEAHSVSRMCIPYSQMIKAVKTRNPWLFASQGKRLAATLVQETFRRRAEAAVK